MILATNFMLHGPLERNGRLAMPRVSMMPAKLCSSVFRAVELPQTLLMEAGGARGNRQISQTVM